MRFASCPSFSWPKNCQTIFGRHWQPAAAVPAPLKSRMSLRTLEEKLAEEGFLRIHNSFLVNMSYIAALQTSGVTLTTGQVLPVSLHGYKAIKMKYMAWRGRG